MIPEAIIKILEFPDDDGSIVLSLRNSEYDNNPTFILISKTEKEELLAKFKFEQHTNERNFIHYEPK